MYASWNKNVSITFVFLFVGALFSGAVLAKGEEVLLRGEIVGEHARNIYPMTAVKFSFRLTNASDKRTLRFQKGEDLFEVRIMRKGESGWNKVYEGNIRQKFEHAHGRIPNVELKPTKSSDVSVTVCCRASSDPSTLEPYFPNVGKYRIHFVHWAGLLGDDGLLLPEGLAVRFPAIEVTVVDPKDPKDVRALKALRAMNDPCDMLERPDARWFEDGEREGWDKELSKFLAEHPNSHWAPYAHLAKAQNLFRSKPEEAYQHVRQAMEFDDFPYASMAQRLMRRRIKPKIQPAADAVADGRDVDQAVREDIRRFLDKVESAWTSNEPERIRAILSTWNPAHEDLDEFVKAMREEFPDRWANVKKEEFVTQEELVESEVEQYREWVKKKGPFRKVTITIESIEQEERIVTVRCRMVFVFEKGEKITAKDRRLPLVEQDGKWRLLGL